MSNLNGRNNMICKIFKDGSRRWYHNNKLHRENGPAVINAHRFWYQNGHLHHLNGPAIEWNNGDKIWFQNSLCHRLYGPAVEYADGYKEYWILGIKVPKMLMIIINGIYR